MTYSPPGNPAEAAPRVATLQGSDWTATELRLDQAAGGFTLRSTADSPAASLLLELRFDPAVQAQVADWAPPSGSLSLLVTERPGLLALGIAMPAGQRLDPGDLLRFTLVPAAAERAASAAPQGAFGAVTDLIALPGEGAPLLEWSYHNAGDGDQNSEVNIADLTPLAQRLFARTDDGDQDARDEVLDADGNGEVNPADLVVIGQNYGSQVGGYTVHRSGSAAAPHAGEEIAGRVAFPFGSPNPGGRRGFSFQIDPQRFGAGYGQFYHVRAYEHVLGSSVGDESNVVQADTTPLKFEIPPAGQQQPDSAAALSPQLTLMPAYSAVSVAGAPAIVYLRAGGGGAGASTLMLARYSEGAWVTEDISAGANYASPQVLRTTSNFYVLAFDVVEQAYMYLMFDRDWTLQNGAQVLGDYPAAGTLPLFADADFVPEHGISLAHAYVNPGGPVVLLTSGSPAGWESVELWRGDPGQIVTGLSFAYDPQDGDPWCVYSAGTVDADLENTTFMIDTQLQLGRRGADGWSFAPLPYADSPLGLDLGFNADGNARLAFFAARDYNLDLTLLGQGEYNLSLLFDGVAADWNGNGFDFSKPFSSSVNFGLAGGFPPSGIDATLSLATGASAVGPSAVCYALNAGTVSFDLTLSPTGGSLGPDTRCYTAAGGGYAQSNFFTGDAGRSFSWQQGAAGLAAAYLAGVELDSTNLADAGATLASPLLYWSAEGDA